MHFTNEEVGLYIRLLCVQWSVGSLPDDDAELASYGKGGTPIQRVKSKFFKGADGRLRNLRLETERAKQEQFRLSRSRNGKLGGRPHKAGAKLVVSKRKAKKSPPISVSDLRSPPSDLQSPPVGTESASSAPPPPSSEHTAFIDGWVQNFKAQFGFDYVFDGGRDGKAVRELLRMGIQRIDILELAKNAWKRGKQSPKSFNCEQASTIHGFKGYFNPIRVELSGKNGHVAPEQNQMPEQITIKTL